MEHFNRGLEVDLGWKRVRKLKLSLDKREVLWVGKQMHFNKIQLLFDRVALSIKAIHFNSEKGVLLVTVLYGIDRRCDFYQLYLECQLQPKLRKVEILSVFHALVILIYIGLM